jgi:hypothetical protein
LKSLQILRRKNRNQSVRLIADIVQPDFAGTFRQQGDRRFPGLMPAGNFTLGVARLAGRNQVELSNAFHVTGMLLSAL